MPEIQGLSPNAMVYLLAWTRTMLDGTATLDLQRFDDAVEYARRNY